VTFGSSGGSAPSSGSDVPEAIGVDIGGTKVAALLVDTGGSVLDRTERATPRDDLEGSIETVVATAQDVRSDHVVAVGIGAAGLVDFAAGAIRFAPNNAWRETPLRDRVSEALGLPCLLDNDANAAAWAEYRFGAARGTRELLCVAVGTGIGGGIVTGGRLLRGARGFGGEIGHTIVEPGGPRCGCGNEGCWEQVASGLAIQRLGREGARHDPSSGLAEMAGGDAERVTGRMVTEAARGGDPAAEGILAEVGRRLGEGIAGLINILDPELVVVGGGASEAGDLLLEPAREASRGAVEGRGHRPEVPIVAAELGNDAGAIGAATLALEELA
jgi:glucokinase